MLQAKFAGMVKSYMVYHLRNQNGDFQLKSVSHKTNMKKTSL